MRTWQYHIPLDLNEPFVERLRKFPREPDMLVYGLRALAALIIRGLLRIYNRFEIVGREHLHTNRSLVIVANHSSHLDTLCLLAALPLGKLHRAFPAAAADYFFEDVPRTLFAAIVLNALPFGRQLRVRQSLSVCAQVISEPGNILIIFPEGTRSTTGDTQEFKLGIGALVAGRDVTVLPCYLEGAFAAWPKGKRFPRPRKIRLIIGAPCNYSSRSTDKSDLCSIATELQQAVKELGDRLLTHPLSSNEEERKPIPTDASKQHISIEGN